VAYRIRTGTPVKEPVYSRPVPHLVRLVEFAEPASDDVCLDVADGGASLATALVPRVRQVTAVEAAPAHRVAAGRVPTVLFRPNGSRSAPETVTVRAEASALPYRDRSFSLVTLRSPLSRLPDPAAALREMLRVCRPGGRLIVAGTVRTRHSAPERERLERLRDPDHVATPSLALLTELVTEAGADVRRLELFTIERPIDTWLEDSCDPAAAERIRDALITEIEGGSRTGARPRLIGGELWFTQSWAFLAAQPIASCR
jgi:SAM-dependent methyltransferase